ncbi:methionyl-tRNA formyltransferase [Phycisphaerales bacterium]|nr:methionyl-tRNA formyltransferase [Phycisphaerales bacterium]
MRIAFFGSGAFGLPTLQSLARAHNLVGIISQPDKPAGRGGHLTPTSIAQWAAAHLPAVPLLKPDRCSSPESASLIHAIPADAWIVIAFGQKLSRALLADRFAVNLHASLLPRWRGAAPINAAILAGDTQTGNSIITLADRMDAGLILAQSRRVIPPDITAGQLHDLLASDGPSLVSQVLDAHAAGRDSPRAQDESLVTTAPKLAKSDGWLNFTDSVEACRRRINGLSPWPGVTVHFRAQPLKLLRATTAPPTTGPAHPPGAILSPADGLVACADSTLQILDVQPAGKRAMPWRDFANGHRVQSQELLAGGPPPCSPSGT